MLTFWSVCMNINILETIRPRSTKFGDNMTYFFKFNVEL